MSDPIEREAQLARSVLENEVFHAICEEQEREAIDGVRKAASSEELLAARARLVAVSDIQKALKARVNRPEFNKARSARKPLA